MAVAVDPVCGVEVECKEAEAQGLYMDYLEQRYWFCSADCKERFVLAPGFYSRLHAANDPDGDLPGERM